MDRSGERGGELAVGQSWNLVFRYSFDGRAPDLLDMCHFIIFAVIPIVDIADTRNISLPCLFLFFFFLIVSNLHLRYMYVHTLLALPISIDTFDWFVVKLTCTFRFLYANEGRIFHEKPKQNSAPPPSTPLFETSTAKKKEYEENVPLCF